MNTNALSDLPAVRLASGVEPQQKWPSMSEDQQHQQNQQHQQKAENNNAQGPKLIELSPTHGDEGTIVTVVVQALPPQMPAKLAFNSLMVDTKQLQAQGITSLVATVPPFQQTHSSTPNVPISICFLDKDMVTETWIVADFNYTTLNDEKQSPIVTSSATSAANQSYHHADASNDSYQPKDNNDFLNSSTAAYQTFYSPPAVNQPTYGGFGAQVSAYQPYNAYQPQPQQHNSNQGQNDIFVDKYAQHARPQQQQPYNGYNNSAALNLFPSAGPGGFTNMLTGGLDQAATASVPPMASAYNSQLDTASNAASSAHANSRPRQHHMNSNGSAVFGFKSATHTPATSVANYQPYPGLVSRANLDIMGDLDGMIKSWSSDEWDHRRRLVQFWREQHGNKITTTFQPVPQGERASNSGNIVVSCIYWMERNDFFITSVDCIYLLECLMDIRFSVEEKNRIRRNLEGFRPLTVSKCKAESADFFKLIMSFPNPKPRNIEKDVKVFPWKTLPYALKKIVTKYTASSYNNVGTHSQKIQQSAAKPEVMPSSSPASLLSTPITENPASASANTSTNDATFYQHQPSNTDRSSLVSSYNAQPYSHELYEPAYYNQQQQPNSSNMNPSPAPIVGNMNELATSSSKPNITIAASSNTEATNTPTATTSTNTTSTTSPTNNNDSAVKQEDASSD